MAEIDERDEELSSLAAIFPELVIHHEDAFCASLEVAVTPANRLLIRFIPSEVPKNDGHSYAQAARNGAAHIERDVELSHLPPLTLQMALPDSYPAYGPPKVLLSTKHDWLPRASIAELEQEASTMWNDYGQCQVLFAYIDYLQQAAERGFDLDQTADGCLVLSTSLQEDLTTFDAETKQANFNAGTYGCSICLEPKKGSSCYQLQKCGHVFCQHCLRDFYDNAISEGDVAGIKCLSPDCGKDAAAANGTKRKRKRDHTLHPRELLAMGIEEDMVRRYVEMKRKKKLEADKSTVYCPRTWCQGPAKSSQYPTIPADLSTYAATECSSDEEIDSEGTPAKQDSPRSPNVKNNTVPPDPSDRLAICERCSLAFCKVCFMGWHGPFARCYPRDPGELSAEEKASYDYIRTRTSPCPSCTSPTQKTMGCNHMKCFQCNTHFCYLCGSWLDGDNPYQHFNKSGTQCYQRLWELEEGDEGQDPGDGRGFAGGRGWEQVAIEAAREAETEETAAAAQAEEDGRAARVAAEARERPAQPADIQGNMAALQRAMANVNMLFGHDEDAPRAQQRPNRAARRQANPFPARAPAAGQANVVRNHERDRGGGNARAARNGRRPVLDDEERQQAELQRFLEMAQRDEEDGWDSDELGEDDEGFVIR